MILYIVPPIRHKQTGKTVRLILWWLRDRVIIKDMDAPDYQGLHLFPSGREIGGDSNQRPTIDLVRFLPKGMGWEITGETAEGKEFTFEIRHDFVEQHSIFADDPVYEKLAAA